MLLLLFDLAIIAIAVQVNDSTAREASRVAAQGDPNSANARAQAIVARANQQSSHLLSNFRLANVTFTPSDLLAQEAAMGQLGGLLKGNVSVQTEVDVRPYVVQYAYGGKLPLVFVSQKSYPITYTVPNTASNTSGP